MESHENRGPSLLLPTPSNHMLVVGSHLRVLIVQIMHIMMLLVNRRCFHVPGKIYNVATPHFLSPSLSHTHTHTEHMHTYRPQTHMLLSHTITYFAYASLNLSHRLYTQHIHPSLSYRSHVHVCFLLPPPLTHRETSHSLSLCPSGYLSIIHT